MDGFTARKNILDKIDRALSDSASIPFSSIDVSEPLFKTEEDSLIALFERKFTGLLGNFFAFDNAMALKEKLNCLISEKRWLRICSVDNAVNQLLGNDSRPFVSTGDLIDLDVAITDCMLLVAQTGTIVLSSDQSSGRALPVYAPVHIVIAYAHQLVFDLKDGIESIMLKAHELPSSLVFASGPSRTGDIEKTLVVGVHGPREVYVLMLL